MGKALFSSNRDGELPACLALRTAPLRSPNFWSGSNHCPAFTNSTLSHCDRCHWIYYLMAGQTRDFAHPPWPLLKILLPWQVSKPSKNAFETTRDAVGLDDRNTWPS